jgi:hypothetical protein
MRGIVGLALVMALLLTASCAQRKYEIGVAVSEKQDAAIKFFAYTTRLPARAPEDVLLVAAAPDSLEGRIDLQLPEKVSVYPIYMDTNAAHLVVHPEALIAMAPDLLLPSLPHVPGRPFVVGKFDDLLTSYPDWESSAPRSAVRSIQWVRLSDKDTKVIRERLLAMRADAAAYGAQAVVDITVFIGGLAEERRSQGNALYIAGRAIVFDQSNRPPWSPARPVWLDQMAALQ